MTELLTEHFNQENMSPFSLNPNVKLTEISNHTFWFFEILWNSQRK